MSKKKKILTLIPLLLFLTGCQKSYYPFSMTDMTKSFSYLIHTMLFDLLELVNRVVCGFYQTVYYLFAKTMSPSNNWIQNELSYYTEIFTGENGGFIFTVSLLACAWILVSFAIGIYKSNFQSVDNQYAPTAVELVKKVIVALVLTFAIPYIAITGFSVASRLGTQAVASIKTDQEIQYAIYEFMDEAEIDFNTVCNLSNRLEVSIDENDSDSISSKNFSGTVEIKTHNSATGKSEKSARTFQELYNQFPDKDGNVATSGYEFFCGATGDTGDNYVSVGENIMNNKRFSKINPVNTEHSVLGASVATVAVTILFVPIALITIVLLAILCWSVLSSFAKRTADVIILIGMSWWYIGSSVSDTGKENHLNELWKKLLSICISQFMFMFEIGIMIRLEALTGGIFMLIAWILVLSATPTVVEELVGTTGTTEAMTNFSKKLASGTFSNLKNHVGG